MAEAELSRSPSRLQKADRAGLAGEPNHSARSCAFQPDMSTAGSSRATKINRNKGTKVPLPAPTAEGRYRRPTRI